MTAAVLPLLLALVLSLFSQRLQARIRSVLNRAPALIWSLPPILTLIFSGASAMAGAFREPLSLLVLAYTCAPVLCAYVQGAGAIKSPTVLDFITILLLWLPIEFAAGAPLVPGPARGFLHGVAYGIALLLGLILFLAFRSFPGLKYNLPRKITDLAYPLIGFLVCAPVLIVSGIAIGFIPPPHGPTAAGSRMSAAAGIIFAGTALPEEILFRSLIQNFLMLRFGSGARVLFVAAFIFGCAHLDNGPQALPNWRYMIVATIAGVAYGRVFQKASTVLSSAALHTMVDWTKHFFF